MRFPATIALFIHPLVLVEASPHARMTVLRLVLSLIFVLAGLISSLVAAIPASERVALLAFYSATEGDNWNRSDNWLGPPGTESTWYGVTVAGDRVIEIDLSDNNLRGFIPSEVGNLIELRMLDLHGSFELSFPSLPPPRTNGLTGSLPPSIGKLKELEFLDLSINSMEGPIPPEIGLLENLIELKLSSNRFSSLPEQMGGLLRLQKLSLAGTLVEKLPPELANLASLRWLDLSSARLTSFAALQGMVGLEELNISRLGLPQFPSEIRDLFGLVSLAAAGNGLVGLPDWIGSLQNLQSLDLSSNKISSMPTSFSALTELRFLNLNSNNFQDLPDWIGDLQALQALQIDHNYLKTLPGSFGNLRNLQTLDLTYNQLSSLPAAFANLTSLRFLALSKNFFTGVPPVFASLVNLEELNLGFCELEGPIPSFLGSLPQLRVLNLMQNQLTGIIPPELGNLELLEELNLSHNLLGGEIPNSLSGLLNLRFLNLTDNALTGLIPPAFSELVLLEVLALDRNDLAGPIPPVEKWKRLKSASFYFNRLEGPIPAGFGQLAELEGLVLGGNNLVGELPSDFIHLADVNLNLQFNGLYTNNPELQAMLVDEFNIWWTETQTVAPADFTVGAVDASSVTMTWTPIKLMKTGWRIEGFYEIFHSSGAGVPYSLAYRTNGLEISSATLSPADLDDLSRFKIRTVVRPHNHNPKNTITSDFSRDVSAAVPELTHLYLPFFQTGSDSFVGFAVSNLEHREVSFKFSAFGEKGSLLELGRNPADIRVASRSQTARLGQEIFQVSEGQVVNGWVELVADTFQLGSFFLAGREGQLDGATAAMSPSRELFFNRVFWQSQSFLSKKAVTYLSVANPANEEIAAIFRLEGFEKGLSISEFADQPLSQDVEVTVAIPPQGVLFRTVEEILGTRVMGINNYIRCTITGGVGAVGFQLIQFPDALIGLPAQENKGHTDLFSAHLASGPGVFASLKISNTGREERNLLLKMTDDGGQALAVVRLTLDPEQSLVKELRELFNLSVPTESWLTGSLQVIADGPGIIGDVFFGDPDKLRYATSVVLQGEGTNAAVFSHVVSTPELFTGLALYNPNAEAGQVQLEVYSQKGGKTGEVVLTLPPGGRVSNLLRELIPSVLGQTGGYILLQSDRSVIAQQMFGDLGLNLLSAVPAVFLSSIP